MCACVIFIFIFTLLDVIIVCGLCFLLTILQYALAVAISLKKTRKKWTISTTNACIHFSRYFLLFSVRLILRRNLDTLVTKSQLYVSFYVSSMKCSNQFEKSFTNALLYYKLINIELLGESLDHLEKFGLIKSERPFVILSKFYSLDLVVDRKL